MNQVLITILGDIVPTQENSKFFEQGDAGTLFTDLLNLTHNCDLVLCNLEVPLTTSTERINKSGPHLVANPKSIDAIKNAGVKVAGISNNHIRDYGEKGVIDTILACEKAGIIPVRAGKDISSAKTPYYCTIKGRIIGVLAICNNEFSYATEDRAGAYGYDGLGY